MEKKKKIIDKRQLIWMIVTFMGTGFTKVLLYYRQNDISLIADDMGQIAIAAFLAGKDWGEVVGQTSYYGFGYNFIFSVYFKLFDNPYLIWVLIILTNIIGMSLCAVFIYLMQFKIFKLKKHYVNCVVAIFLCINASVSWSTEYGVFISVWVTIFLLWKTYCSTKTKKKLLSIIFAGWICYSFTLHERNMTMFLAFIVLVILYALLFKRYILNWTFIPSFILFYILEQIIKKNEILLLWASKATDGTLKNTSIINGNQFWFLDNIFYSIKIIIAVVVSNIYTLINRTYGLAVIVFVLLIYVIICMIRNKSFRIELNGKEIDKLPEIFFVLFSTFAAVIIICGLAIQWGRGIANQNFYSYKGLVYYRYYLPYFTPAILGMISYIRKNKVNLFVPAIGIYSLLYIAMRFAILGKMIIAEGLTDRNIKINWAWIQFFKNSTDYYFAADASFIVVILVLLLFLGYKRKVFVPVSSVLAIGIGTLLVNCSNPLIYCGEVDKTYELYREVGDLLPMEIYSTNYVYSLQYMLQDKKVVVSEPTLGTGSICFSKDLNFDTYGYYVFILDEREHLYTDDEKIASILREYGLQEYIFSSN